MSPLQPVAVLHQQAPPPPIDGVSKPFKPGGYRDSGADIAYALAARGLDIVTPVASPRTTCEADWTFADTREGIVEAVSAGTRILWANTVLHARHSLVDALERGLSVVAHDPALVERHDDKVITNALLERHGLSVPPSFVAGRPTAYSGAIPLAALSAMFVADRLGGFPVVVKPIRGRGSQGVRRVDSFDEMIAAIGELTSARDASSGLGSLIYGEAVIVERYLSGEECTVAVLPPGKYPIRGRQRLHTTHWALWPVLREGHHAGIAPYSGEVPVSHNSRLVSAAVAAMAETRGLMTACEQAAALVGARACVRIDCRRDELGQWRLFDLNMKPNLTGPSRPGRDDQSSLVSIAAASVDWSYGDLVENLARQNWRMSRATEPCAVS